MNQRLVRTVLVVVCAVLLSGLSAAAGGLYFGVPLITLDLTTTLTQLPVAVNGVFDSLETTFTDLGVPPAEVSEIRAQFDQSLADLQSFASTFPAWVPVPLIGGGIEFGLPLSIIDGIRLSGGWLSGDLVRFASAVAGVDIPQPLIDFDWAIGEESANLLADLDFSTWMVSTELVKRFDLFLFALNLGAGCDLIGGEILPTISVAASPEMMVAVDAALDELHLDALSWSSFAVHAMIGFELGPPFLRLYGDIRWTVPLSQTADWWGIRLGPVSALLGFVIRF